MFGIGRVISSFLLALWIGGGVTGCGAKTGLLVDEQREEDGGGIEDSGGADTDVWDAMDAQPRPDVEVVDMEQSETDTDEEDGECVRTCEPGPCSSILQTEDYDNIQAAIDAAQRGDIIQIERGEFETPVPIEMAECTHLFGDHASTGATTILREDLPGTTCEDGPDNATIIMANGSSVNHITIDSMGGCALYLEDTTASVNDSVLTGYVGATMRGASNVIIYGNSAIDGLSGLIFRDNSTGYVSDSSFGFGDGLLWPISTYDIADPVIRNNIFQSRRAACQVCINDFSSPDIGQEGDEGGNLFYHRRYEAEAGGCFNWPLISNGSPNDINAYGNFYDASPFYCGDEEQMSTYDQMLLYPDPYSPEANITTIYDVHDSAASGRVLYGEFRPETEF